jgi:hypothetical protein
MGFLWSSAFYFLGFILIPTILLASGLKDANHASEAIKLAYFFIATITLLSPLAVIWLTAKGKLPGTRKVRFD